MTQRATDAHRAPVYAYLVPLLSAAARRVGYAIAVHGSMARDLDVVAVPWTDEAVSAEELLAALLAAIGFTVDTTNYRAVQGPGSKPHGRQAWTIPLDGGCYIDLSVTPLRPEPAPLPSPPQLHYRRRPTRFADCDCALFVFGPGMGPWPDGGHHPNCHKGRGIHAGWLTEEA